MDGHLFANHSYADRIAFTWFPSGFVFCSLQGLGYMWGIDRLVFWGVGTDFVQDMVASCFGCYLLHWFLQASLKLPLYLM